MEEKAKEHGKSNYYLPATPKYVWKMSTASSGLSEIPPFSVS